MSAPTPPPLDHRAPDRLLAEAVEAVSEALPAWTGTPDAGHALLTLCTTMTDRLRHLLNQAPQRLHRTLLHHTSTQRRATAASGRLEFTTATPSGAGIPAGTQVSTTGADGREPVNFTTLGGFIGGTPLGMGILRLGRRLAPKDPLGGNLTPLGKFSEIVGPPDEEGPEGEVNEDLAQISVVLIRDQGAFGGASVTVHVDVNEGVERVDHAWVWEVFQAHHSELKEYPLWSTCRVIHDDTEGLTRSGRVELTLPLSHRPIDIRFIDLYHPLPPYWQFIESNAAWLLRCRPTKWTVGTYYQDVWNGVEAFRVLTAADALQGELVPPYDLGRASGLPDQRFLLPEPVLATEKWPLVAEVDNNGEVSIWNHVATLSDIGPEDRSFVIDHATREVVFGILARSGEGLRQYGGVPPRGARIRLGRYLTGGGIEGNVAAHTVTVLREDLPHVTGVTNPEAFSGGSDPLNDADGLAPLHSVLPPRAVIAEDYARIAAHPGTGAARALPYTPAVLEALRPARGTAATPSRGQAHLTVPPPATDTPDSDLPAGTRILAPDPDTPTTMLEFHTLHPAPLVRHLGLAVQDTDKKGSWQTPETRTFPTHTPATHNPEFVTCFPAGFPLQQCALTVFLAAEPGEENDTLTATPATLTVSVHGTPRRHGATRTRSTYPVRTLTPRTTLTTTRPPATPVSDSETAPDSSESESGSGSGPDPVTIACTAELAGLRQWRAAVREPLATRVGDAFEEADKLLDDGYPPSASAWLTCRLSTGPVPVRVVGVVAHVVSANVEVEQYKPVPAGTPLPGTADGNPGQRIALPAPPAPGRPPAVSVTHDGETLEWKPVKSFVSSGPQDRHVVIDPVTSTVCFGPLVDDEDGTARQHGALPPAGATLTTAREYHATDGTRGNLTGTGTEPLDSDPAPAGVRVTLGPTTGATDAQAPPWQTQSSPREPATQGISLLVVPDTPGQPDGYLPPTSLELTEQIRSSVEKEITQAAPTGVELTLDVPDYKVIGIKVTATPRKGSASPALATEIATVLHRYFNPVNGGPNRTGWPFGRAAHAGDAYREIERLSSVDSITDLTLHPVPYDSGPTDPGPDEWEEPQSKIDLAPQELIRCAPPVIILNEVPG
ncbi:hypothetical protein ABZ667_40035 [Streptomyces lavendulae]|uniref:hypothetical protein n=1 Tax=Streptomyces lavendulae TaxID=1914 RepID=UPI0033E930C8